MVTDTSSSTLSPAALSKRCEGAARGAISFLMQQAVENPGVLSLAAGLVDPASLPVQTTQQAAERLFADDRRTRQALQYGTTTGADRLRKPLARLLQRLEAEAGSECTVSPGDLLLTTGSQQFLSLTAEVLFDPGDICLVSAPTYFVMLGVLDGVGVRAIPVPADDEGMRMDALEKTLSEIAARGELNRVKLIYLVSNYENPSGVSLSVERREEAVAIAQRWSKQQRIYILDDAAYRELRYDGPPTPSVMSFDARREHVLYTQTFSKSYAPGLRVGFGAVPAELLPHFSARKGNEDFGSANFNQHLLANVFEADLYEPHVEQVRAAYRAKRDAMLTAADEFFADIPGVSWVRPQGGLYVWMTLPDHITTDFDSPLFATAVKNHNVMYVPGVLAYAADENGHKPNSQMRLSFGVQTPENLTEGIRRLSLAVREMLTTT